MIGINSIKDISKEAKQQVANELIKEHLKWEAKNNGVKTKTNFNKKKAKLRD